MVAAAPAPGRRHQPRRPRRPRRRGAWRSSSEHRLVTLLGAGGVGKTRLAARGRPPAARERRPDRPSCSCELAAATPDSAVDAVAAALGHRRPARASGSTSASSTVLARRRGGAAARQLRARPRPRGRAGRGAARRLPRRDDGHHQPRAAARRRRAAVPGARRCRWPPRTTPAERLFVERARAVVAGLRPRRARSGSASPRSCVASTGCRSPSSWPPPACTRMTWPRSPPGSTAGSGCSPPARAPRPATGPSAPPSSLVGRAARRRAAPHVHRALGLRRPVHGRRRRRRVRPAGAPTPPTASTELAERSLVMRAPGAALRAARDPAGLRRSSDSSRRAGSDEVRDAARPARGRADRGGRPARAPSRAARTPSS